VQVIRQTFFTRRPRFFDSQLVGLWVALMAVSSWMAWENSHLIDRGAANLQAVFHQGEVWRLVTAVFLHSDLGHLLSNAYMILLLGFFVQAYFGWPIFPVAAVAAGAVVNGLTVLSYPPESQLLGASGVVYWLAGFWLVLFFLIERQRSWMSRSLRVMGVGLLILFPSEFQPHVSYRAHAWGFGLGVVAGLLYFLVKRRWIQAFEVVETETDADANAGV
jgi:rhomboid protease GluP